jgi:hypothetical protein
MYRRGRRDARKETQAVSWIKRCSCHPGRKKKIRRRIRIFASHLSVPINFELVTLISKLVVSVVEPLNTLLHTLNGEPR